MLALHQSLYAIHSGAEADSFGSLISIHCEVIFTLALVFWWSKMFYSHQLLSKKHPMGQIWIAATVRANINRTKAAKINIVQICKQILNPPVPLALRLSGILMGGIVQIYKRKVFFLYEDMNAFLMKINIEAVRTDEDRTKLPKRKYRAKYENITMASDEIRIAENTERPMREPSVPLQEGVNFLEETFFVFPEVNVDNLEDNDSPRDHFQADIEDITLQENAPYSPHSLGGMRKSGSSLSADSILGPLDDFLPEFQLPGQRLSLEVGPVEDCAPDKTIPDNRPPELSGALHTIFEEQLPEPEMDQQNAHLPEAGSSQPKRETRSARRNIRKRNARVLMYDDETEISKKAFAAWLQDTSDIVGRKGGKAVPSKAKDIKQRARAVQQNWNLSSVCVSLKVKFRPEPTWAPALQEMWRRLVIPTPSKPTDSSKKQGASPTSSGSKQNSPMDIDFPVGADVPGPLEPDFPVDKNFQMETGLRIEPENSPLAETDHHSLGSVEKLREALQTPSTGSREDIFGNRFGLRTPALFAPLTTEGKSSKRSMSASYGGSLSYDSEGEPPTSGKSKRRNTGSPVKDIERNMSPISGELPEMNIRPRRASGKSDMIDYFASGDFQAGILAQSQLLEDTSNSTQPRPADSINNTTIVVAKLLREHFNKLKEADVYEASLNNLSTGLDKTRAARMFYQVCVLASNESIFVKQEDPYGDIILKRGVTL